MSANLPLIPHLVRWESLPNEIWFITLKEVPDIPTLHNLIIACPFIRSLVGARCHEIFEAILDNAPRFQFANMASAIMTLRHGGLLESTNSQIQTVEDFIAVFTSLNHVQCDDDAVTDEGEDDEGDVDTLTIHDALSAIEDIALLYRDTDTFTHAFILSRCRQPSKERTTSKQQLCSLGSESQVVSPTELHRIHRALWRFWTLCELGYRKPSLNQQWRLHQTNKAVCYFLATMTSWELEEVECIYYFMRELYYMQLVRSGETSPSSPSSKAAVKAIYPPATVCSQPHLIQRLLSAIGHNHPLSSPPPAFDSEKTLHFQFSCAREAPDFGEPHCMWPDSPPEANHPSEGWLCYKRNCADLCDDGHGRDSSTLFPSIWDPARWPVVAFHQWGYCMWDRERLRRWGMLERTGRGKRGVDGELWGDNDMDEF